MVFDLKNEYAISKIDVTNDFREDSYVISASKDGITYDNVATITNSSNDAENVVTDTFGNATYRQTVTVNGIAAYRYYKISGSSSAVMKFYDVQMWANIN